MCVHTKEIPKDVLNTYCWIHPTYTLSSAHWKRVGVDVPHPGVDKTMPGQQLLDEMKKQCEDYGTDYRRAQVFLVDAQGEHKYEADAELTRLREEVELQVQSVSQYTYTSYPS